MAFQHFSYRSIFRTCEFITLTFWSSRPGIPFLIVHTILNLVNKAEMFESFKIRTYCLFAGSHFLTDGMPSLNERLYDPDAIGLHGSPHVNNGRIQTVENCSTQDGNTNTLCEKENLVSRKLELRYLATFWPKKNNSNQNNKHHSTYYLQISLQKMLTSRIFDYNLTKTIMKLASRLKQCFFLSISSLYSIVTCGMITLILSLNSSLIASWTIGDSANPPTRNMWPIPGRSSMSRLQLRIPSSFSETPLLEAWERIRWMCWKERKRTRDHFFGSVIKSGKSDQHWGVGKWTTLLWSLESDWQPTFWSQG